MNIQKIEPIKFDKNMKDEKIEYLKNKNHYDHMNSRYANLDDGILE